MRPKETAEANSAASVGDPPPWRVVSVRVLPGHRLHVGFIDGTSGEVDTSALVFGERAGVFAALRDPTVFAQARVSHGAVEWPGDLDLAPDAMYEALRAHGCWKLE